MSVTANYLIKPDGAAVDGNQPMQDAGEIKTTVASPGSDTAFPTEKAIVSYLYSEKAVASADYTVLDADSYTDIDFTTAAIDRTCTLPTLADNLGRVLFISKIDNAAGHVSVTCEGAEEFLDGETTIILNDQGETLAVRGTTNGWKIF